jgi:hypothetical protein
MTNEQNKDLKKLLGTMRELGIGVTKVEAKTTSYKLTLKNGLEVSYGPQLEKSSGIALNYQPRYTMYFLDILNNLDLRNKLVREIAKKLNYNKYAKAFTLSK